MDTKATIQKKFQTYSETHPWARSLGELVPVFERHSGLVTFLFSIGVAVLTFVFKWLYAQGLNGYFSYYHLPSIKLETSFEDILIAILSSFCIALLLAFFFLLFWGVSKKDTRFGLKQSNLLLLDNTYLFLSITSFLLFTSEHIPVLILFGVLGLHFIFFIGLQCFIAAIRDSFGAYRYQTNQKKRMLVFILVSIVLNLFLFLLLKSIFFTLWLLYSFLNFLFFAVYSWFYFLFYIAKPEQSAQRLVNACKPQRQASWRHVLLAGCGMSLALLFLLSIWLTDQSLTDFGKFSAGQKRTYTIITQYQCQDWAVVYETSEKFYLAPVKIDAQTNHLQFLSGGGQIVSNEGLLLQKQTFTQVSPPEAA